MFKKSDILLSLTSLLFLISISQIDRIFFKRNQSFCISFLFTSLPTDPNDRLPTPSVNELNEIEEALNQRFYYLGKGAHCYAFASEDDKYVIKFHRYASHMRLFPWLKHPFAYYFNEKRRQIKKYNLKKLRYNFENYKNSFLHLKEETGLLLVHLHGNPLAHHQRLLTLVDRTQAEYQIPLENVTYILQKKANLIYPTLDSLYAKEQFDEAKIIISNLIDLITVSCQKGYINEDPILRRNYGLIGTKAIHIDIGDLVQKEGIERQENYIPYLKAITESLRKRLETTYPLLLSHYETEIKRVSKDTKISVAK